MTTASNIITYAFREGNIIAIGATPSSAEQTEGLERLNRLVQGLFGSEMGENLMDFMVPAPQRTASVAANYPQLPFPTDTLGDVWPLPFSNDPDTQIFMFPPQNSRIVWGNTTLTCYFPEAPNDGARMALISGSGAGDSGGSGKTLTIDGNGKYLIVSGSPVASTTFTSPQNTQTQWLYRADLGAWMPVADMLLTDQMPFPSDLDDLFTCLLAIRLAPRFNKVVAQETKDTALRMLKKLKARYQQTGTTIYGSSDFPRSLQSYISGNWWW